MALLGNLTGSSQYFNDDDFYSGTATQSLRFGRTGPKYLTRTPSSASNRRTWTWSGWIKPSIVGQAAPFFSATTNSAVEFNGNAFRIYNWNGSSNDYILETNAFYRDASAWYHIAVAIDTTQGTASNRIKVYINGEQITSFSTETYPSENFDGFVNSAAVHRVGSFSHTTSYSFDGYMAEVNFIDGLALTPTSFGETKNGVWIPKKYNGSYGTNGFRLQFNQVGVGTASTSTIGADTSGNTNHFTSSGIVASDCAMPDSPENNFCTWNPLTAGAQTTFTEGNLKLATVWSADLSGSASTFFPESGKWYWELRVDVGGTYPYIGITSQEKVGYSVNGGTFYNIAWHAGGTSQGTGSSLGTITKENIPSFADDDIMSFALDCDARKIWVAENNTYADSGDPENGSGENASWTVDVGVSPVIMGYNGQGVGTIANFGQDDTFGGAISSEGNTDGNGKGVFKYAPPSGFLSLCSANLPEPTIGANSDTQADDHFNTVLYTGAPSGQGITGVGFQPDWTWIKSRSHASSHVLTDSNRGVTESLFSDTAAAESTLSGGVTAFGTDGFTLGTEGTVNTDTRTYVAWNWKANGGTTVTNEDGSIDSTVQANTTAGFSIGTFTKGSGVETVGHGLSVAPDLLIVKRRNGTGSWAVYHSANTANPETDYLRLNLANATADDATFWGDTAPTTSVFSIGAAFNSGETLVCYAFHSVEGYSKFGKYIGNGNADGTFVFTGFRPRYIMTKLASDQINASGWIIYDTARHPNNVIPTYFFAHDSDAESDTASTYINLDIVSNGFKLRAGNTYGVNQAGATYIYMAFAEAPFKYANAR